MELGPSYFVRFSSDGTWLASCGQRSVQIRTPGIAKPKYSAPLLHVSDGEFSPDSRSILLKTTSGALHALGPLDAALELRRIDTGRGEGAPPRYSTSGRYIVDASWSGQLVVLESATGAYVSGRNFSDDMLVSLEHTATGDNWFLRHAPRATTGTQPPDPDYFTVWSIPLQDHQPKRVIRPDLRFVRTTALSASGDVLALIHGAPPVNLSVIDAGTGETLHDTKIEIGGTGGRMAWAPNGQLAVVERHSVRAYSIELDVLGRYELEYACDVAFSPHGDLVGIGSWESGRVLPVANLLP